MLAGPLPHIPSMINKLVPHLYLGIFEPQRDMLKVYVYCALKNRSSTGYLADTCLPLSVLDPVAHVMALSADCLLEIPPHSVFVVLQLCLVLNSMLRRFIALTIDTVCLRLSQ